MNLDSIQEHRLSSRTENSELLKKSYTVFGTASMGARLGFLGYHAAMISDKASKAMPYLNYLMVLSIPYGVYSEIRNFAYSISRGYKAGNVYYFHSSLVSLMLISVKLTRATFMFLDGLSNSVKLLGALQLNRALPHVYLIQCLLSLGRLANSLFSFKKILKILPKLPNTRDLNDQEKNIILQFLKDHIPTHQEQSKNNDLTSIHREIRHNRFLDATSHKAASKMKELIHIMEKNSARDEEIKKALKDTRTLINRKISSDSINFIAEIVNLVATASLFISPIAPIVPITMYGISFMASIGVSVYQTISMERGLFNSAPDEYPIVFNIE